RSALLDFVLSNIAKTIDENSLRFVTALAQQCFNNEYVFDTPEDELKRARGLWDTLITALESGTAPSQAWPVTVAMFFPLHSLPKARLLLEGSWSEAIRGVLIQQVREPNEELAEQSSIPRLTKIEDRVSKLVQEQ